MLTEVTGARNRGAGRGAGMMQRGELAGRVVWFRGPAARSASTTSGGGNPRPLMAVPLTAGTTGAASVAVGGVKMVVIADGQRIEPGVRADVLR
jgi:hypothetical protein